METAAICYNKISVFQNQTGMKLIEVLSPQDKDYILDLGCGTGWFEKLLLERVGPEGHIVAVDPDQERIKLAKEMIVANNLRFLVACDKDFPEDCYDKIIAMAVIHWIEDKKTTFTKIYENLKPGGQFAFTTMINPTFPQVMFDILEPFGPQILQNTLGLLHFKSSSYYKDLGASIGYEITHLEEEEFTFSFPNIDTCIDFYCGVFHANFDRSSALLEKVRKKYANVPISFPHPIAYGVFTKPINS